MAVGWRAVRRSGAAAGATVAIRGGGPIGIGVMLAARANGCRTIVFEPSPERASLLRSLGAEQVADPTGIDVRRLVINETGGAGAAASFDAAGVAASFEAVSRTAGPGGTILAVVGFVHVDEGADLRTLLAVHGQRFLGAEHREARW